MRRCTRPGASGGQPRVARVKSASGRRRRVTAASRSSLRRRPADLGGVGAPAGGAGRGTVKRHAQLPVADDRAPAVQVPADQPDDETGRLARRQPAAVGAVVEDEVVHLVLVGVRQHDHQPVAAWDLDRRRVEAHVARLDVDDGGVAGGRGDPRRAGSLPRARRRSADRSSGPGGTTRASAPATCRRHRDGAVSRPGSGRRRRPEPTVRRAAPAPAAEGTRRARPGRRSSEDADGRGHRESAHQQGERWSPRPGTWPARSSTALAARTGPGPPPSATGTR